MPKGPVDSAITLEARIMTDQVPFTVSVTSLEAYWRKQWSMYL